MGFAQLGLIPELLSVLELEGFLEPTEIQRQAIPLLLAGRDVIGIAQTGTGKTASFVLPMLQRLAPYANHSTSPARHPTRALILAPTRELALQIAESVERFSRFLPLRTAAIFGGVALEPQTEALLRGAEIVIATPGRALDHLQQNNLRLNQVEYLVLDEADRMLEMGFLPDVARIIEHLPSKRQTALFSATFPQTLRPLALQWLHNPEVIEAAAKVNANVEHRIYWVMQSDKREALRQLLTEHREQAIVFVDTKVACGRITSYLQRHKIHAQAIHGDKNQQQRLATLEAFRRGQVRVLVATDVAARGIDLEQLPLVINLSLPPNPEEYVHRIGRTGRAGHRGVAISFLDPSEEHRLAAIERLIGASIPAEKFPYPLQPPSRRLPQTARETRDSGSSSTASGCSQPRVREELPASWRERAFKEPLQSEANAAQEFWLTTPWQPRRPGPIPVLLGGTGRRNP